MAAFSSFKKAAASPVETLRGWLPWRWVGGPKPQPAEPKKPAPAPESDQPRIGVALSSGGAKGLAHIGVIQVLEENGIEVAKIAGTSMGAYVGACWASGMDGEQLEDLAGEMKTSRDLWSLVDPVPWPRRGFIRGHKIEDRLRKTLGDWTFDDLERPLRIVATEFETFAHVVIEEGDVASAVLASIAIPGVVVPVERYGIEYVDGGVCDPLPVGVLEDDPEIDYVIAVNVLPTLEEFNHTRRLPSRKVLGYRKPLWRRPFSWLNKQFNWFRRGNLLDILRSSAMASQMRVVEHSADRADIHIRPIDVHARWHDYTNYRRYIQVGRACAEKALPAILALMNDPSPTEETSETEAKR